MRPVSFRCTHPSKLRRLCLAVRRPVIVRLGLAASLAGIVAGCATGTAERTDSEYRPGPGATGEAPDRTFFDIDEDEEEAPSESHLAALDNQPTDAPVEDVPDALRCPSDPETKSDPGTKLLHRLNRLEYNNTVRDLLGVDWNPANAFPKDDFGDSFDNNARALSVSPLLTEAYLTAAQAIAQEVLVEDSPVRTAVAVCSPDSVGVEECATEIVTRLLTRAFRRPVFDQEIETYVDLLQVARDEGASFWEGVSVVVEATLLSTHFLFRVELDPLSAEPHALTSYELASRLSYYLWSSMPDEALFARAAQGDLNTERAIRDEVSRMLDDPKADALLDALIARWLEIDDISQSNQPAAELFPEYTPSIQQAMEQETRLFMRDVLFGQLPYREALTAEYTYLNDELSTFYGLDEALSNEFERVSLEGTERVGLLTQGSILTLTSAPDRVSQVRRGVYVLSNLLCSAPPPPPANVQGNLDVDEPTDTAEGDAGAPPPATLAERLRRHSEDPDCNTCHSLMDPIGLGLENFDAIGRYRDEENGEAIDPSGQLLLTSGTVDFSGARELSELLAADDRLSRCAARKVFTFAVGRLPSDSEADDACRIEKLDAAFGDAGHNFKELVTLVALTDSFRGRRASDGEASDEDDENESETTAVDAGGESE